MSSKELLLISVLDNPKNFDITFISKNPDDVIYAIKKTLRVNCEYFKAMFFSGFDKKQDTIIVNYDKKIIFAVLKYIICGDIEIDYNNIMGIFLLSREFCLLELTKHCKKMVKKIDLCRFPPLEFLLKYGNVICDKELVLEFITCDLLIKPFLTIRHGLLPLDILSLYLEHQKINEYSKIIFLNTYVEKYPENLSMISTIKENINFKKINDRDLIKSTVGIFKHFDNTMIQRFFLDIIKEKTEIHKFTSRISRRRKKRKSPVDSDNETEDDEDRINMTSSDSSDDEDSTLPNLTSEDDSDID